MSAASLSKCYSKSDEKEQLPNVGAQLFATVWQITRTFIED